MNTLVTVSEHDTHVLLTMDDGKANALSFDMLSALNAGLDQAAAAAKVVVLTGRPGKFSAGFDLNIMGQGGEPMHKLLREGAETSARLMKFDTPVLLGVSGHALAMGALLCLSADYRIGVSGDFKLGLNEVAIGMTLPWFGVELARARLAKTHFNSAVGLAQIYDPETAVTAGYLDETVAPQAFEAHLDTVAQGLATLNMDAHRGTKERVREDFYARSEEALRRDFSDLGAVL